MFFGIHADEVVSGDVQAKLYKDVRLESVIILLPEATQFTPLYYFITQCHRGK